MIYILIAVISCSVGYAVGVFRTNKKNTIQSISVGNNLLIDARDNREIASIVHDSGTTEKTKILEELVEIINSAAMNGRTFLLLHDEFNDLDKKIERYFTKQELLDFFKNTNYVIDFRWDTLDYSNIRKISW